MSKKHTSAKVKELLQNHDYAFVPNETIKLDSNVFSNGVY